MPSMRFRCLNSATFICKVSRFSMSPGIRITELLCLLRETRLIPSLYTFTPKLTFLEVAKKDFQVIHNLELPAKMSDKLPRFPWYGIPSSKTGSTCHVYMIQAGGLDLPKDLVLLPGSTKSNSST